MHDRSTGKAHPILRYRYALKLVFHGFLIGIAFLGSYYLRFEFEIPPQYLPVIRELIPIVFLAKAAGFLSFGLFHGWWRYVTIRDVLPIMGGCTLGSFLFWSCSYFMYTRAEVPLSIYAIDWS